ncbi:hypothetical protein D9619_011992 [Psilocybe cf. subviscida]|uniref:Uncharacterized protein n=1 Tax=Psilocybe cf. subviscida TaxID=2480587 RepID=A0A8H5B0D6_9AGAR|nr:hypothetical protein D9619_011992 [Psilocybe cf. subviscida]
MNSNASQLQGHGHLTLFRHIPTQTRPAYFALTLRIVSSLNTLQLGDILRQDAKEWENQFALVHQRLLALGFQYDQWDEVIRTIYTVTAPGGWAQLLEVNPLSHCGDGKPFTARFLEIFKALEKLLDWTFTLTLRGVPIGAAYGEMGKKWAEDVISVFRELKSQILRSGGFGLVGDEKDYDNLMDQMELEWDNLGYKFDWYIAVGRKA